MNFSTFRTADWLKIGGALGFLTFGFFDWVTVSGDDVSFATDPKVFDFFVTGTIPWILVLGTAIVTVLPRTGRLSSSKANLPMLMLLANGVAAVLILIRLVVNPLDGKDMLESIGVDVQRGLGMILSTASVLVATAGAFIGFTESGGRIDDLRDIDKLKGGFGRG